MDSFKELNCRFGYGAQLLFCQLKGRIAVAEVGRLLATANINLFVGRVSVGSETSESTSAFGLTALVGGVTIQASDSLTMTDIYSVENLRN